eukprot:TRINITY_DN19041_c0_g1_i1.p1 TRINITY_DN19041_c0_g1~~TRINITY_DN19041_c0_g1_i1.p1  ORF type:complete len:698 (+),score=102.60 TRINITY_DN19041_c0_g1_i1:258-2096(+)
MGSDSKRRERDQTESALQFVTAALQTAEQVALLCKPHDITAIHITAAEISHQLGNTAEAVRHLDSAVQRLLSTNLVEALRHPSGPVNALCSCLAVMANLGIRKAEWLEVATAGLASPACHYASDLVGKGGGLELLVKRAAPCVWGAATTDLGFEIIATQVLIQHEALLTGMRAAVFAEVASALQGPVPQAARVEGLVVALVALVAQNCLTGWIHYDTPDVPLPPAESDEPLLKQYLRSFATLLYVPEASSVQLLREAVERPGDSLTQRVAEKMKKAAPVLALSWQSQGSSGAVDDTVLEEFYDSNVYPVWVNLGTANLPVFASYLEYLKCYLPPSVGSRCKWAESDERILVAGCGSGHQLALVLSQYSATKHVKGIDLSRANLAFAEERLGTCFARHKSRYSLEHDDLTSHVSCDVRPAEFEAYDVIECCGVLHHCKDPEAALTALMRRLKPGGVLHLGVYSAAGTEPVRECIRFLQGKLGLHEGFCPTREKIQEIREFVDSLPSSNPAKGVLRSQLSYYAAAPFRDMLFHPRAHYFTLRELRSLTESVGLELLSLTFDSNASDVAARFKYMSVAQDEEMRSWDAWQKVESAGIMQALPWHNLLLRKSSKPC